MYYSIDGKLVKNSNKNNKINENFINIPFFQFTSAKNAGLKSTKDIESENNVIVKGDINLEGKMISGGQEINLSKLNSENFSVPNLNVDGKSILSGNVGIGTSNVANSMTVLGLDKYTSDGNRLSTSFGYGQLRICYGSNNEINEENKSKYDSKVHLDIGYNIGKIGSLQGNMAEFGGAYLQTQVDFVGHTPICINPMGGNVGVGTTNPVNKFHIVGDSGLTISPSKKSGERFSIIRLGYPYASNHDAYCAKIVSYNNHSKNYASDLRFHTHAGPKNYQNADERMRITSDGKVGIGTDNPIQNLDVKGAVRIHQRGGEGGEIMLAFAGDNPTNKHWHIDVDGNNTFRIFRNDRGTVVPALHINSSGGFGIRTYDIKHYLTINGGTLGQKKGDKRSLAEFHSFVTNKSCLRIETAREKDGKDWVSTSTKIVNVTDVTEQGYVKFNGADNNHYKGGVSIGNVTDGDKLKITSDGMNINPFAPNPSGTYYAKFNGTGNHKYWHFICGFEANSIYNLQTQIDIEFSVHSMRYSTTGHHNRGSRSVGKLSLQIISDSPTNRSNSSRSDGRYEIVVYNNSNYTVNGPFNNNSFFLLNYDKYYYLVTSAGSSDNNKCNYVSYFKINIFDPFIKNVEIFDNSHILNTNTKPSTVISNKTDPKFLKPAGSFLGDSVFGTNNYLFLNINKIGNGNKGHYVVGNNTHSSI